jgi:hypothetical protein
MSKTIILSEEKFNRIIKGKINERVLNGPNPDNQKPLGEIGVGDDGTPEHNVSTVDEPEDETTYDPNGGIDIENPRL